MSKEKLEIHRKRLTSEKCELESKQATSERQLKEKEVYIKALQSRITSLEGELGNHHMQATSSA